MAESETVTVTALAQLNFYPFILLFEGTSIHRSTASNELFYLLIDSV